VLDVGCGDGKITAAIAQLVRHRYVLGLDSSQNMIDFAKTHYSALSNLQFVCMDARSIEVDREFDVIFSNAALHWVDDQPAFLQGAYKALRGGGRLSISCGGYGNAAELITVFQDLQNQQPWQNYLADYQSPTYFYNAKDYLNWLIEAGFEPLRVELVPKDMTHSGKSGLAGWMRTTGTAYTHRIPECDRERFIDSFAEAYLSQYPLDRHGHSHVKMVRLEVDALKPDG
jgi:trans-aconitate methyltransferase